MKYQKMDLKRKVELRKAVLLIRFRTTNPTMKSRKYMTYKMISKSLNLTEYEVQHICRKALLPKRILSFDQIAFKLD